MKTALLLATLLLSLNVHAKDDVYVDFNVMAYHFDRSAVKKYNFNEVNPGIGITVTDGTFGKHFGMYKNSVYVESVYALASYSPIHYKGISVGVVGGGITGYKFAIVSPAAGLIISAKYEKVGINIMIVPDAKSVDVYGFAGIQISYKI
jgi:hypothetical protein